ncbi:MAG: Ig-like domain-containing protein, partial [Candidatus Methanomethylophilaceae archaeon]|nr:Ig-like domain-containing protein [Candidatus Methanomethylophilaceae archaeon]
MKNVKTITLAIVLTAICSFALVPAFASDAAGDDAELKLESVTAHAGDKNVEVKLDLVYNPGIWGISAEVNYDEKLTLVSVAHGELVDITDGPLDFNPYTVYGEGKSTTADVTATGTVITLRFDVAEDASGVLPLTFGLVELYNVNGTEVDYLAEDGFITIAAPEVHVTGVSLNKTSLELETGEQETLTAAIEPGNATNKEVAWKTSNGKVATVGSDGVVKAVSAGTAVITVTTVDGGKAAVCEVTVKAKVIPVTGVTLDKSSLDLSVGSTYTLKATVSPSDATNKGITWSTSNASVATVANGIVKGVSAGTATITVTTEDGNKTAACEVTVKEISVTGVLLDKSSLSLTVGSEAELKATVLPPNAGNKNVSWSTSNASVATVDNGKVKAVSPGTATITVTTEDGNKTATCNVTVTEAAPVAVTGVTLDRNTLGLVTGSEAELKATVMPSDAANKNVSWTTSSASVATVDNGKVKAVSPGTAVITVITEDGNKTATCTVTVTSAPVAVTGVTLDKIALALKDGAQGQLTAIVTPSDATNKDVTWSSSNASVATVDNGKVKAV